MSKEIELPEIELDILADALGEAFIQRRDLYARQFDNGSYVCIHKPLKHNHLVDHLRGEITLGAYVLDQTSQAKYIVLDADDNEQFERLATTASNLVGFEIPAYLEESRRGGHLWLFFSKPIPGKEARKFGNAIIKKYDLGSIELFPKQDRLDTGPGSLIRLPFGVHKKSGRRYRFTNIGEQRGELSRLSLYNQIPILCTPKTIPAALIRNVMSGTSFSRKTTGLEGIETPSEVLSKRIKESISVLEFVGQYVELSPNGRGKCPFHDDQHASFSVNADRNYWYCFAGCGGGSIIDFWMKYQKCDFIGAVRALARLLL